MRVRQTGTQITITVEDDGPGIPPHLLERVFEPFFRGEDSRNLDTGGAGLGLCIARRIIAEHGGSVTLANRVTGGLRAEVRLGLRLAASQSETSTEIAA